MSFWTSGCWNCGSENAKVNFNLADTSYNNAIIISYFFVVFHFRYCLFGLNVGLTEKFESNSQPMKIHVSEPCKQLLPAQYKCDQRDDPEVREKCGGHMSHFLVSKENRVALKPEIIKALLPTASEMPTVGGKKDEKKADEPKKEEKNADAPKKEDGKKEEAAKADEPAAAAAAAPAPVEAKKADAPAPKPAAAPAPGKEPEAASKPSATAAEAPATEETSAPAESTPEEAAAEEV